MIEIWRQYFKCDKCGRVITYRPTEGNTHIICKETITPDELVTITLAGRVKIDRCLKCQANPYQR